MRTKYLSYLTALVGLSVHQSALIVCVTSYNFCLLTATAQLNITSPEFHLTKKRIPTHKKYKYFAKAFFTWLHSFRSGNDVTDVLPKGNKYFIDIFSVEL